MSLKLASFEIIDAVSYSPSIVTVAVSVAVCDIFSVKEWYDLENQVRGCSRLLKIAPFDRPYATVDYYYCYKCHGLECCQSHSYGGTLQKSRLVAHCKYSTILYHFRVI